MKSLIPKKGKESALNVKRTESTSNANKKDEQSKLNPSKKSDKESIKLKKELIPKHQLGGPYRAPLVLSPEERDYNILINGSSQDWDQHMINTGRASAFGARTNSENYPIYEKNLSELAQPTAPAPVYPRVPLLMDNTTGAGKTTNLATATIKKTGGLKPRPLATIIDYKDPITNNFKPKWEGKKPRNVTVKEDKEPRQWGKARQYAPLLANIAGNTLQYLMSKPKLIGVIKPKEILNANRVAVAQVAPVSATLKDSTAKVRPAYFGSDSQLGMLAGKMAQDTIQNINFKNAVIEGRDRDAKTAANIQAQNLANQGNAANLNSDTAALNAKNAQDLQYQQAQLAAKTKYEEENSARKIGFVNSLTGAIGGHFQQREELGMTKGLMDLATLKEQHAADKLAEQYEYLYGKSGSLSKENSTKSKQEYDDANEAFKKKYGLG